jgi:protease-4
VWPGTEAKRLKLIDNFGGLDAAVAAAAKRAGIKGEVRVVDIEKPEPAWMKALKSLNRGESEQQVRDPWAMAVRASQMRLMAAVQDMAFLASGRGATMQAACMECAVAGTPRPAAARQSDQMLAALLQSSPGR